MARFEKDEVPMLSATRAQLPDESVDSNFRRRISRTQSASISIPIASLEQYERQTNLVGHTGPLRTMSGPSVQMSGPFYATPGTGNLLQHSIAVTGNEVGENRTEKFSTFDDTDENHWNNNYDRKHEHLLRSGQLGMCYDPYCTTCPAYLKVAPTIFDDPKFHNSLYGDAKGFGRNFFSFCYSCIPGVMNPHTKVVQQWNKFLAIFCLVAIFVDPLFFFLIYVKKDSKCIVINWTMAKTIVLLRSLNDFAYFLNILLQIMILFVLPNSLGSSGYSSSQNLLCLAILGQYIPRLFRFLRMIIGQSPTGFIFDSASANFVINLLNFMLFGHAVGSFWYFFGLQRVNQCLRDACHRSNQTRICMELIDCDPYVAYNESVLWGNNKGAIACLDAKPGGAFPYGIYLNAVPLTTETKVVNKYVFALFWGFQQISTLAGNQTPSYFVWEVLFIMAIIASGLVIFTLLVGNIQNFVQTLGHRRREMQLRGRDVEQWMSHRCLPEDLRRRVRQAERFNWATTRGVNDEKVLENLPEDLLTDIRRHLFKFVKKVRIFSLMDEPILDAIRERLKQTTYIKGSRILSQGGLVEKMVFVVSGKLESIGEDGIALPLSEGDSCGEELLTWYLEHSSVSKDGIKVRPPGQRLLSNKTVRCLTNVEAFSLRAADIEEVTTLFTRFLQSPHVQGALRYESPYWRSLPANRIQVAWRYRKKRRSRANTSQTEQMMKS